MMRIVGPKTARLMVGGLVVGALACGGGGEDAAISEAALGAPAEHQQGLAKLRQLVAPFHDLQAAMDAGWNVQFTPCLENPPVGAMGFHYGNPAYIDAEVSLLKPELLLYAPRPDGSLAFVGVEYIVPFSILPATAEPPTLLGHAFHTVEAAQLWGLHIWIGRHNPAGMFADWNPMVSCANAVTP